MFKVALLGLEPIALEFRVLPRKTLWYPLSSSLSQREGQLYGKHIPEPIRLIILYQLMLDTYTLVCLGLPDGFSIRPAAYNLYSF